MRVRAVLLAAALVLAPLGARAADLVVWWEEGCNPEEDQAVRETRRRLRAEDRQARSSSPSTRRTSCRPRPWPRSRPGTRPTSCSASTIERLLRPVGPRGPARRPRGRARPLGGPVRPGRARARHPARRDDGPARPLRAADGALDQPRPRLEEPARARRLHARRHPEGVGAVLVLLVRQGPAGRAQGHRPRRPLGRRPAPCRPRADDTDIQFWQFVDAYEADYVTRDGRLVIDEPAVRARLVKALDSYTAHLPQGLHPARRGRLGQPRQQQGLPGAGGRDDAEPTLSIPSALRATRPEDYYKNAVTIEWPSGAYGQPLAI